MRTLLYSIAIAFFTAMLFSGCNKNKNDIIDGLYKGTFTVEYSWGTKSAETLLELKNGRFSCASNTNRIPAGGSGTFTFRATKAIFQDENFWTADFDWNLILNGEYKFSINGKRLILFTERPSGKYKYDLEKQ